MWECHGWPFTLDVSIQVSVSSRGNVSLWHLRCCCWFPMKGLEACTLVSRCPGPHQGFPVTGWPPLQLCWPGLESYPVPPGSSAAPSFPWCWGWLCSPDSQPVWIFLPLEGLSIFLGFSSPGHTRWSKGLGNPWRNPLLLDALSTQLCYSSFRLWLLSVAIMPVPGCGSWISSYIFTVPIIRLDIMEGKGMNEWMSE